MVSRDQVFISYCKSTDTEFARRMARCLRAVKFNVWLDDEQLSPGDDFTSKIQAAIAESQHALCVVSAEWLKRDYTTYELETFARGGPGRRRIAVLRFARGIQDVGPRLHRFHNVEWVDGRSDEAACFWQVVCGLTGEPPGPVEDWRSRGEALLALVPAAPPTTGPTPRPVGPAAARSMEETHLACDRDAQWGALVELASRRHHEVILLGGPEGEAHLEFLKRIERRLPRDPPRRVVSVTWSDYPCPRQPERLLADLAEALGTREQTVESELRAQLNAQNVFVLQPVLRCFDSPAPLAYLSGVLPACLDRIGPTQFGLKVVQPVEWNRAGVVPLLGRWLKAALGASRDDLPAQARDFMSRIQTAVPPAVRVVRLPDLRSIQPADLEAFCEKYNLPRARRKAFVEDVMRGARDSQDVILKIRDYFPRSELT